MGQNQTSMKVSSVKLKTNENTFCKVFCFGLEFFFFNTLAFSKFAWLRMTVKWWESLKTYTLISIP